MGKRSRKSKGFFLIYLILLLIIGTSTWFGYNYNKETINNKNEVIKLSKEIQDIDKEIKEKDSDIKKLDKDISYYQNIDQTLKETKNNFYKEIKILEDNILSGKSNRKIAYLTFDDGPYYNTYKVLDILDKYNVKATFFTTNTNGENCFDKKEENCWVLYKEYIKRGHTIANHTYTHGIRRGLYKSKDSFIDAVIKQEELVKKLTDGYVTNIVRFPGGSSTDGKLKTPIIEELRKRNYGWVDWTAQDGDGGKLSSKEQAMSNFKNSINGKIEVILFHDYNGYTTTLLPEFINYLKNNGYEMYPLFYESNMINK